MIGPIAGEPALVTDLQSHVAGGPDHKADSNHGRILAVAEAANGEGGRWIVLEHRLHAPDLIQELMLPSDAGVRHQADGAALQPIVARKPDADER